MNRNKAFCLRLENLHELQIDTVNKVRRRLNLTGELDILEITELQKNSSVSAVHVADRVKGRSY